MAEKETRVGLYASLRDQIDKMDTLSFDDPDRDKKYGLNGQTPSVGIPIIHEDSLNEDELKDSHIKKNTLSISIDDLIKQNDDYTMALEKKELDKKYRSVKKRQRKENRAKTLRLWLIIVVSALIIAAVVLIWLHLGGII